MRIFISSVIKGMELYRDEAAKAARVLGHEVMRSENFGARPESPQVACLQLVREADAVVVLLGERYGTVQPSGLSATHEEYREAREGRPVLVFIQHNVEREAAQEAFVREVQSWAEGHATERFSDPESLRDAVTRALHQFEVSHAAGGVDAAEMVARAEGMLPDRRGIPEPALCLAVVGAPRQAVLRPARLEDPGFQKTLMREAQYGEPSVLDSSSGLKVEVHGNALGLVQDRQSFTLDQEGSMLLIRPARADDRGRGFSLPAMIEEDIRERLRDGLSFMDNVLSQIDPTRKLSHVAPVAALLGAGYSGWRTRAEHAQSPLTR